MSEPKRIQRKREKGWRMPEGAIYVGRPSPWGNPFVIGMDAAGREITPEMAVDLFADFVAIRLADPAWRLRLLDLRGHDLVCWCPLDAPCHADVLLHLANAQWAGLTGKRG